MMKAKFSLLLFFCVSLVLKANSPKIDEVWSGDTLLWKYPSQQPAKIKAGETLTIIGTMLGSGTKGDYSKIMIGKFRALERDLPMYEGDVILSEQRFIENNKLIDSWKKDIESWSDTEIKFKVPEMASEGPLVISRQEHLEAISSLKSPIFPFRVSDPLTERIESNFTHQTDLVWKLSEPVLSNEIPVVVENTNLKNLIASGEAAFWQYDYNIGLVHHMKKLDWDQTLWGDNSDPITCEKMKPETAFGAIPLVQGEVPEVALKPYKWTSYPLQQPLKPIFGGKPLKGGTVTPTGFVGYVKAEAKAVTGKKGSWVGFNCASCHSQRITYESAPGIMTSKVFPGLPNPNWSMKWAVMGGGFPSLKSPKGEDKTLIVYSIPNGVGEHTLIRDKDDGSIYADDSLFSPIAIPIITRHTPVRRALSRTEMIAGFEGSYIHSEEPDGAIGAMYTSNLKALTAYMATLDSNDEILKRVGIYRWLLDKNQLQYIAYHSEGMFVSRGIESYPDLVDRINRGKKSFERDCKSCHQSNFGTYSDENQFSFTEVGTYFSPTLFQRQVQSVRTAIMRNLYWVEKRGLLHDGHVKSMEDLLSPDRCDTNSELYKHYYTMNESTFKIPKGNAEQEKALRRVNYFSDVPWDSKNLYWDYQKMRKNFGVKEFQTVKPVSIPEVPHPWCVKSLEEVEDLVAYLLTL